MNISDLHAINLILVLFIAIAVPFYLKEKTFRQLKSKEEIKNHFCVIVILFVLYIFHPAHLCNAGQPFLELIIPSIGIYLSALLIEKKPKKVAFSILLILIMFFLSHKFNNIVHSNEYIGNPKYFESQNRGNPEPKKVELQPQWHTFFTRIYKVKTL